MKKLLGAFRNAFQNLSIGIKLAVLFGICCTVLLLVNYFVVSSLIYRSAEENIIASNMVSVQQVTNNLKSSFTTILRYLTSIRTEAQASCLSLTERDTPQKYTEHYNTYLALYNRMIAESDHYPLIESMQIVNANGDEYAFSWMGSQNRAYSASYDDLLPALQNAGEYVWMRVQNDTDFSGQPVISVSTTVRRFGRVYSIITIHLNESYIQQYLTSCQLSGAAFLYDPQGRQLFAKPNRLPLSDETIVETLATLPSSQAITRNSRLVISMPLALNEWSVVVLMPWSVLLSGSNPVSGALLMLLISSVIVAMIMNVFIARSVSKPLKKLTELMRQVQNDKLTLRFSPRYHDEIGLLATSYDCMMDEIMKLTERIKQEQDLQKNTYMKLLQMQIKPHFLYNSLETTRFMVEMKDERAVEMMRSLSRFYKLMLGTPSEFSRLSEELEQLRAYLTIMCARYSSRFTYSVEAQSETLNCRVLRFLLQPVVENAIYHGIKPIRRPGRIEVSVSKVGANVAMRIWDNGKGIVPDVMEALCLRMKEHTYLEAGRSIGLVSVHQRLQLAYGEPYGITLTSHADEYTEVIILVPFFVMEGGSQRCPG